MKRGPDAASPRVCSGSGEVAPWTTRRGRCPVCQRHVGCTGGGQWIALHYGDGS